MILPILLSPSSVPLQAILSKFVGDALRLAGLLHLLDYGCKMAKANCGGGWCVPSLVAPHVMQCAFNLHTLTALNTLIYLVGLLPCNLLGALLKSLASRSCIWPL